jgi:hypothetical protein
VLVGRRKWFCDGWDGQKNYPLGRYELYCCASLEVDTAWKNTTGEITLVWPLLDIRISELAITPDGQRLVAIGLLAHPTSTPSDGAPSRLAQATLLQASAGMTPPPFSGNTNGNSADMERRIVVYDLETRQEIWYVLVLNLSTTFNGLLTGLRLSGESFRASRSQMILDLP